MRAGAHHVAVVEHDDLVGVHDGRDALGHDHERGVGNVFGQLLAQLGFYDYLNELPEEFLEEHDYSKEEVKEGAQSLADRKGLGLLGEGLD